MKLLKESNFCLPDLTDEWVTANTLTNVESFKDNPIAVIYQSGYLTIKGYEEDFDLYQLGFPNKEVAEGFIKYLAPYCQTVRHGQPETVLHRGELLVGEKEYRRVED